MIPIWHSNCTSNQYSTHDASNHPKSNAKKLNKRNDDDSTNIGCLKYEARIVYHRTFKIITEKVPKIEYKCCRGWKRMHHGDYECLQRECRSNYCLHGGHCLPSNRLNNQKSRLHAIGRNYRNKHAVERRQTSLRSSGHSWYPASHSDVSIARIHIATQRRQRPQPQHHYAHSASASYYPGSNISLPTFRLTLRCLCPLGYTGYRCETDINECLVNNGHCEHICENTYGGHYCKCMDGYKLLPDNRRCEDIDECQINNGGCQYLCENANGTYRCLCKYNELLSDDRRTCIPKKRNLCDENNGGCSHICIATEYSVHCECRRGYKLMQDARSCVDVDECATWTNICPQRCVNRPGTYACDCFDGYQLLPDRRNCKLKARNSSNSLKQFNNRNDYTYDVSDNTIHIEMHPLDTSYGFKRNEPTTATATSASTTTKFHQEINSGEEARGVKEQTRKSITPKANLMPFTESSSSNWRRTTATVKPIDWTPAAIHTTTTRTITSTTTTTASPVTVDVISTKRSILLSTLTSIKEFSEQLIPKSSVTANIDDQQTSNTLTRQAFTSTSSEFPDITTTDATTSTTETVTTSTSFTSMSDIERQSSRMSTTKSNAIESIAYTLTSNTFDTESGIKSETTANNMDTLDTTTSMNVIGSVTTITELDTNQMKEVKDKIKNQTGQTDDVNVSIKQHRCVCYNGSICDHETYQCVCHPGYYGLNCDQKCAQSCRTQRCNRVTGFCECDAGYFGHDCNFQCSGLTYGPYCRNCDCESSNTDYCHVKTGECICKPGFTGVRCDLRCPIGHWGVNCSILCDCNYNNSCDPITGVCRNNNCPPGLMGNNCDILCPNGYYGVGCETQCRCPENAVCNPITGNCVCKSGFTGFLCRNECKKGYYGPNCENKCECKHDAPCNATTGCCKCPKGYIGPLCENECPEGYYGKRCEDICKCMNGATKCDKANGDCLCPPGFTGTYCEKVCDKGFYGENCAEKCNCKSNECDAKTGDCLCPADLSDEDCAQEDDKLLPNSNSRGDQPPF